MKKPVNTPVKELRICRKCGSQDVVKDAWAKWNIEKQEWVLDNVFDAAFCNSCEGETTIDEALPGPQCGL